ncbi:hypothetical protein AAC387_Pa12g0955 [Persea americana]
MGVYRHLLGDPGSIDHFRDLYKVPANVEVRPDDPDDGLTYRDGWMPFWLVSVVEGGINFPLHPPVRDCLWEWRLCPCQLLPNGYKIIMGVVRLNQILKIGLGVLDIENTYDLCKSAEGDTYYLRLRVRRTGFVTALEDSNRYAGEDRVLVRGGWEFGEAKPATTVRVPRKIGIPPNFREKRELARRNRWKVNSAWHEQKGIGNRLRAERGRRLSRNSDDCGAGSAVVTVAISTGRLIESGDRAPAISAAEPVGTSRAKPRPFRRRLVASSSEEEEEEEEMLRQHGRRYAAEDLSVVAFGDIGSEVRNPLQAVAATPSAVPGGSPAPDAETVGTATIGAARPEKAEVVSAPPPAVVMDDSPPEQAVGAGGQACSTEVAEGRRPEKRPRVEASPGPSSPSPAGGTILPPPLAPWRPAIEEVPGRQLAETDRATDPQVVAVLGQACALPQDMARWAGMDNESLLLSSMRSLVSVSAIFFPQLLVQCCFIDFGFSSCSCCRGAKWALRGSIQSRRGRRNGWLKGTSCGRPWRLRTRRWQR